MIDFIFFLLCLDLKSSRCLIQSLKCPLDILLPLDYFQNSIGGVADGSAPGLCLHDGDPHHLSRHHHSLSTTGQHQEDAGQWAQGKNSS